MTDREALKLALEALVLLTQAPTETALDYADNAIDALRERLAQPAQQPEVIKFGHIFEDEDGVLVMKDFRINANKSTDYHELILLNAVINRLLNERDEYTDKEKNT